MRPPALPALVAAAVLAGCSAVPGDLPAAADQRWEPLVTAPADAAQDSRSTAILPENLTRPSELPPDPRSFEPGGALDTIYKRGYLRVGVSRDTQTRGAWNPVHDRFEGFDVDLALWIAAGLFGLADPAPAADPADPRSVNAAAAAAAEAAKRVRFVPVSYAERLPAVERGNVDILLSTLTYTASRAARIGLSAAYFTAYPRMLSHRADPGTAEVGGPGIDSPEELAGKRVCAPRATTTLTNLENIHRNHDNFEIVGNLNELSDCLVAFQQGEVDVVAANDASLVGMLTQDATAVLGTLGTELREYYSAGFRRDDTELAGFINAVLEHLRHSTPGWVALCERWAAPEMPCESSRPPEPRWAP